MNDNEDNEVVDAKDSILISIKKLLGISKDCTDFDTDIIIHINTTFMILNQLGVGEEGFQIEDNSATWDEFVNLEQLSAVKSYVHLKVKLLFDPPTNSFLVDAINESIKELEWRLNVKAENYEMGV